jgi:hypothetical protein
MSLDFWPGTDIRRSTHNGFTMGLTGERGEIRAAVKPSPKARTNPGLGRGHMRPIQQRTREGALVREFPSISAAAKASRIPDSNIVRAASGLRNTAGGYVWRYAN